MITTTADIAARFPVVTPLLFIRADIAKVRAFPALHISPARVIPVAMPGAAVMAAMGIATEVQVAAVR